MRHQRLVGRLDFFLSEVASAIDDAFSLNDLKLFGRVEGDDAAADGSGSSLGAEVGAKADEGVDD